MHAFRHLGCAQIQLVAKVKSESLVAAIERCGPCALPSSWDVSLTEKQLLEETDIQP